MPSHDASVDPTSAASAAAPTIAAVYLPTIVTIEWRGAWRAAHVVVKQMVAEQMVVEQMVAGQVVAADRGALHVITAWNPGDERPTADENDQRNALLHADLVARGFDPLPALGSDPASTHAEASWAVVGMSDADACALGAKYGQVAVFRITAERQTVLGCFAAWSVSRPVGGGGA